MPDNKLFGKNQLIFPGKIALITDTFYAINGVSRTYQQFADYCRKKNIHLDIFTLGEKASQRKKGTVNIYQFASVWPIKYYYDLPPFDARIISPGLKERLLAKNYDLIHLATPGSLGLASRLILNKSLVPKIGVFHTLLADYARDWTKFGLKKMPEKIQGSIGEISGNLAWQILKWFYAKCDLVLAPSHDIAEKIKVLGRPVELFPRGVDLKIFNPSHRKKNLSGKKPIALYVGRLSVEKNLDLLVKIWQKRNDCELWLAGNGPYQNGLKAQLPKAKFFGYLSGKKLSEVYASADFFVFPSVTDTFGNAVLEAAASGLPSIVTDCGGPKELVKNKITGFIIRPTAPDFSRAINYLIKNKNERKKMGENAHLTAQNRNWPKAFSQLLNIYTKLCNKHQVSSST